MLLFLNIILCALPVLVNCKCLLPASLHNCRCRNSTKTLLVDCSGLGFNRIPPDIPPETSSLVLDNNDIRVLHKDSFLQGKPFFHLKTLSLKNNSLERIETGAFEGLAVLTDLNLFDNKLETNVSFEKHTFIPLQKSLKTLDIRKNLMDKKNRKALKYPHEVSHLTNLETLKLDCLLNKSLPIQYGRMHMLKSLIMTGGLPHCFVIHAELFDAVSNLGIKEIGLGSLNIGLLYAGVFKRLKYLEVLDISHNSQIGTRLEDALAPLKNSAIKKLYLNDTGIIANVNDILNALCHSGITELFLDSNEIYEIQPILSTCFEKLEILSLGDNCLYEASEFAVDFYKMKNIRGLNISSQQLQNSVFYERKRRYKRHHKFHICQKNTACPIVLPKNIIWIDMSFNGYHLPYVPELTLLNNNSLKTVNLMYTGLQTFVKPIYCALNIVPQVETFIMNNNQIRCFNSTFFNHCNWLSLKTIQLGENTLGNIRENICNKDKTNILGFLSPLSNLEMLGLSGNGIDSEYLNDTVFKNLSQLRMLDLSRNRITKLSFQFDHMSHINTIDLSNNSLQCISKPVMRALDGLQGQRQTSDSIKLNLAGNLLSCKCECIDFITWLTETKITLLENSTYKCLFSDGTIKSLQKPFEIKDRLYAECYSKDWLYNSGFTLFGSYISIIIVCLIARFRHDIKYLILKFEMNKAKMRIILANITSQFHAFVSCSLDDYIFVHKLLKNLETKETGLKFCIAERNFICGEWKAKNTVEAIQGSEKSIFIISSSSIVDNWCKEQFKVAHQVALDRGKQTMIFILMPEVDTSCLSGTVRLISRTVTCLRWPENQGQGAQRLFWLLLQRAILEGDQLRNTRVKETNI